MTRSRRSNRADVPAKWMQRLSGHSESNSSYPRCDEPDGISLLHATPGPTGFTAQSAHHQRAEVQPRPVRQPDAIFSVTARYAFAWFGDRRSEVFVTDAYTGRRASDIANTVWLPEYNIVNVGFLMRPTNDITIRIQASNVFDEVGLTEGNPRQTQVVGNANAVFYGARDFRTLDPGGARVSLLKCPPGHAAAAVTAPPRAWPFFPARPTASD